MITDHTDAFVPVLRTDVIRHDLDGQAVVWSPLNPEPVALDPVATVMLDVVDGEASLAALTQDVHEEVGVPYDVAHQQVGRIVELFHLAGLLETSETHETATEAITRRELLVNPPHG